MSLLLSSKRTRKDPGYFRIGHVVLAIPPEEIQTNKVINNQELTPLRSQYSMFQKTGQSRWDISISWKALVYQAGDILDYSDWEDVQRILAIFKAAPFVEIENDHIRQIIAKQDPRFFKGKRMAFGLRQLRIDTIPDIVDGLQISLTATLFNYDPYSSTFGYKGSNPKGVSALDSPEFKAYIDRWISNNLTNPRARKDYPGLLNWKRQAPGAMTFNWRVYEGIPNEPPQPPTGGANLSASYGTRPVYIPSGPHRPMEPVAPPPAIKEAIVSQAQRNGVDPNLALAVAQRESRFNPTIPAFKGHARGLFQLEPDTARRFGVTDVTDPVQSSYGGTKYLAFLLNRYHNDIATALTAYVEGEGATDRVLKQGLPLSAVWARHPENNVGGYIADVQNTYAKLSGTPVPPTPATLTQSHIVKSSPFQQSKDSSTPSRRANQDVVNAWMQAGWYLDHQTDRSTFLFYPEALTISDPADAAGQQAESLYPNQISIQFVNNLAQLPLAAYQYPTQQHIGPAGTMISVSMTSNGIYEPDQEPVHPGLSTLTGMVSGLEDQYHTLRGSWRAVSSIHRMQAVLLENQILNMLGIYGVLPQSVTTATIPDSANQVQVGFICSQYENVFEQLHPYIVKGTGEYDKVWHDEVFNGSALKQFDPSDARINPLRSYVASRSTGDLPTLFTYLTKDPNAPQLSIPAPVNSGDVAQLKKVGLPYLQQNYPALATQVSQHSQLTYNDFILLSASPGSASSPLIRQSQNNVLKVIKAATAGGSSDPTDQMYTAYLDWLVKNDRNLSSAIQQVEMSTDFQQKLKKAVESQGPGAADYNLEHVAYKDLGLSDINDSPGNYFVDDASTFKQQMDQYLEKTSQTALDTADYFNQVLSSGSANVAASDPTFFADSKANGGSIQQNTAQKIDNVSSMLKQTVIPYSSMTRAFPTFKLFLAEEDNSGVFFMFDDFYSYGAVLNIEVIRYQDKPDTAVIQLTNLANLLSHKLYDGSVEGKFEFTNSPLIAVKNASNGDVLDTGIGGKVSASKTLGRFTKPVDLTSGFDNSTQKVNLQYFALQTGTKIQIRVGFSNNPDELEPIFTGTVTQVDGNEVMTITAQGFVIELMESCPDDLSYNGYNIASLGEVGVKLLTAGRSAVNMHFGDAAGLLVHGLGKGPAYGGFAIMGEAGNTTSIIGAMLKSNKSVHFGHWQVGTPQQGILKGYGYAELAGLAASAVGIVQGGSLLQTSHDRSAENIFVDHFLTSTGQAQQAFQTRDFQVEHPLNVLPAAYYIPKDPNITPWRIIQDIKRRYPEYIVACKPYGFPYGADATLIFANPNDFYLARPGLAGDQEIGKFTKEDSSAFSQWWESAGRSAFKNLANNTNYPWPTEVLEDQNFSTVLTPTFLLGFGTPGLDLLVSRIDNAGDSAATVFSDVIQSAIKITQKKEILYSLLPIPTASNTAELENLRKQFDQLLFQCQTALQRIRMAAQGLSTNPRPNDRLKPVRKWILVTDKNIIKNDIQLNGQIYNAVRVDDNTIYCNDGVKHISNHAHVLDVDRLIIDPINNVRQPNLMNQYAASFMKEELGKMYRGELVLTGMPEIDPFDILLLYDSTTNMVGPIEVETVIHSLDQEGGYISIVKPRALVMINEAFTAGMLSALKTYITTLPEELSGLVTGFLDLGVGDIATISGGAVAGAAGTALAATTLAGQATAVATATGVGVVSLPVSSTVAVAGAAVALGSTMILASKQQGLNPMLIAPLCRYDQPWVAGIEGWALEDLHTSFLRSWQVFKTYDLLPTLYGLREVIGAVTDSGDNPFYLTTAINSFSP